MANISCLIDYNWVMCGRYALFSKPQDCIESLPFKVQCFVADFEPHYNATPSSLLPVLRQRPNAPADLSLMNWGLIPSWAKDRKISHSLINARCETAHEKPSFRHAFRKQRALIPANGWYEWLRPEKQPYYHKAKDDHVLWFAGLWEEWLDRETGQIVPSYSLLTKNAYKPVADIHDRMPVLMNVSTAHAWIDPKQSDVGLLHTMMESQPVLELDIYPVTKKMNKPQYNDMECVHQLSK